MTIVVGTDFSEAGARAARMAGLLVRALGTPLHLVHVCKDPRAPLLLGTAEERFLSTERAQLTQVGQQLSEQLGIAVSTELGAGTAPDALCGIAERNLADLLVAAAGGRKQGVLGGTAERVVRSARVPVLALRSPSPLETWLERTQPLRVLVGSDLGAAAQAAEAFVGLLQRAGPVDVEVVCVAHPAAIHERYDLPPPHDLNQLEQSAAQLVSRDLRAQGDGVAWADSRRVRVVTGTAAADTHLAILAEQADLLVVGVRKRSWLAEAWYGSVASGVLRAAPTSVVCVPRAPVAAIVTPRPTPRVLVAATDFSVLGDEAVAAAFAIAGPGATVYLVHVLSGALDRDPDTRSAARAQLKTRIPSDQAEASVVVEVLDGAPAASITGFARRVGAHAICIGSHGRSGLGALLLGSISRDVLSCATVPVVVVPPGAD